METTNTTATTDFIAAARDLLGALKDGIIAFDPYTRSEWLINLQTGTKWFLRDGVDRKVWEDAQITAVTFVDGHGDEYQEENVPFMMASEADYLDRSDFRYASELNARKFVTNFWG